LGQNLRGQPLDELAQLLHLRPTLRLAQSEALCPIHPLFPGVRFHSVDLRDNLQHFQRPGILLGHLVRLVELAPRVRQARRVRDPIAQMGVHRIPVALQSADPAVQKLLRPVTPPSHPKVKYHRTARTRVLEHPTLMCALASGHALHLHGRLVALDVIARQKLLAHRSAQRTHQIAHAHHDPTNCRLAEFDPRFAPQDQRLAIERQVIGILVHQQIDDDRVGQLALLHDPRARHRRRHRHATLAAARREFLAPEHPHEVLGRLAVQMLAGLEAHGHPALPALRTTALLLLEKHLLLDTRQMRRQFRAPGVTAFARTHRRRLPLGALRQRRLRLHLGGRHAGFQFEQLQLVGVQRLVPGPIPLQVRQTQHLTQTRILALQPLAFVLQHSESVHRLPPACQPPADLGTHPLRQSLQVDVPLRLHDAITLT